MTDKADFPAAHSMDTTWFAVDQDGFIAVMQSGEAGAVPCAVNQTESEEEVLTIVRKALSLGEPEPPDFASLIRSADQTDPVTNLHNLRALTANWRTADLNMYAYSHDGTCENWIAGPYVREASPEQPLNIVDLPLEVKQHTVGFPGIRFAEKLSFQPAEYHKCESWENWYLTTKGKVKAFPGTPLRQRLFGWIAPSLTQAFLSWTKKEAQKEKDNKPLP